MKVLILAGGYATRMHPLTVNISKPLLKVGNRPMIDWILDKVNELKNINEIAVITNEKFYKEYETWKQDKNITLINDKTTNNENRLGMFGDISLGMKQLAEDDILVIGGDNLFEFDLNKLIQLSEEKNAPAIGAFELNDINEAKKMGIFEIDKNNKIITFEEKPNNPKSMLASTACYFAPLNLVKKIRKFNGDGEKTHMARFMIESEDTYVYPFKEQWIDIGSKEQYARINKCYSEKD